MAILADNRQSLPDQQSSEKTTSESQSHQDREHSHVHDEVDKTVDLSDDKYQNCLGSASSILTGIRDLALGKLPSYECVMEYAEYIADSLAKIQERLTEGAEKNNLSEEEKTQLEEMKEELLKLQEQALAYVETSQDGINRCNHHVQQNLGQTHLDQCRLVQQQTDKSNDVLDNIQDEIEEEVDQTIKKLETEDLSEDERQKEIDGLQDRIDNLRSQTDLEHDHYHENTEGILGASYDLVKSGLNAIRNTTEAALEQIWRGVEVSYQALRSFSGENKSSPNYAADKSTQPPRSNVSSEASRENLSLYSIRQDSNSLLQTGSDDQSRQVPESLQMEKFNPLERGIFVSPFSKEQAENDEQRRHHISRKQLYQVYGRHVCSDLNGKIAAHHLLDALIFLKQKNQE